jgi:hypothetical protein
MLRGTCDRSRLLDLVENFTLFSEHKAGLVRIIAQNHQYLGVNNTIASMLAARELGIRLSLATLEMPNVECRTEGMLGEPAVLQAIGPEPL